MEGNAYSRLIEVIRGESSEMTRMGETDSAGLGALPAKIRLGTVTQREPLKIRVAGIEQPTKALRINERLTKESKHKVKLSSKDSDYRSLTGTLSGPVDCTGGCGSPQLSSVTGGALHSEETIIRDAEVMQTEIDLEVGDTVLLLTGDDQIFYILMKVVEAV